MSKLPPQKQRVVVRVLLGLGFRKTRQVGSHLRLIHPDGRKVTIAIHSKEIPRGTMQSILDQADLTVNEYLSLLKK
jgi:predicted RNA binding protein YcfA (HicA-like mRNA interferase family)